MEVVLLKFILSGQNYHRIGSLQPKDSSNPNFAQLNIDDPENKLENTMTTNLSPCEVVWSLFAFNIHERWSYVVRFTFILKMDNQLHLMINTQLIVLLINQNMLRKCSWLGLRVIKLLQWEEISVMLNFHPCLFISYNKRGGSQGNKDYLLGDLPIYLEQVNYTIGGYC